MYLRSYGKLRALTPGEIVWQVWSFLNLYLKLICVHFKSFFFSKVLQWLRQYSARGFLVKIRLGSMTTGTYIKLNNHLHKYRTSVLCLLIFGDAKCYLDFAIVEEVEKCSITLYCLPSNPSLFLYVSQHPERTLNQTSFNVNLSQIWLKCLTITTDEIKYY